MDKYIYNEKNGLWYELLGDYYLPCLKLPEEEQVHIDVWGQRHRRYLKNYRKVLYTNLLISGKLNSYLADIDWQAVKMFIRLVNQMAEAEGITEEREVTAPLAWVGRMNNIRNSATKIVNRDLGRIAGFQIRPNTDSWLKYFIKILCAARICIMLTHAAPSHAESGAPLAL